MDPSPPGTLGVRDHTILVRRFRTDVLDGPDRGASCISDDEELTIGTAEGVDLQLTDRAVSRHHCVLAASGRGLELRDLGSTNGTLLGEHEIVRGFVRSGARLRVGGTTIVVTILDDEISVTLPAADRFGQLLGGSVPMRRLYALLERCASSDATVVLHGETGTGKELVAETIHEASLRRTGPFVVVDCGALPRELTESELFGHVRGAFTGAEYERVGAFEAASGGTIFLDEIGELPLELQPLLLRALESRTIRRVGGDRRIDIDVRVIAASHRDLRYEVNARRFRADLYYRLDVLRVVVPSLADRADDIPLLATQFWRTLTSRPLPGEVLEHFARQRWPGNVRELRNAVERVALLGRLDDPETRESARDLSQGLSYSEARERMNRTWEVGWIRDLLAAHDGNISRAARAARMARSQLRMLLERHGMARRTSAAGSEDTDAEDE